MVYCSALLLSNMSSHLDYVSILLESERLLMKPIVEDDAAFYLSLMNSPKWLQFIGDRGVYTEPVARDYIRDRMVSQWLSLGYGNFIVSLKATGQKIGAVGIFTRPGLTHSDLGFAFLGI
jgi:[ribosomal protein S5]-alanine N-acetyltransferase